MTEVTLANGTTRRVTDDHQSLGLAIAKLKAQGGGFIGATREDGETIGFEASGVLLIEPVAATRARNPIGFR